MGDSDPGTPDLSDEYDANDEYDQVAAAEAAPKAAANSQEGATSSGGGGFMDGGGGFMPEDMGEGGFMPDEDGGGGFMPDEPQAPGGEAQFTIEKPSGRHAEWRIVPVGGFVPHQEFAGATQKQGGDAGNGGNGGNGGKTEKPKEAVCKECGSHGVNKQLYDCFSVAVCRTCSDDDQDTYKLMTKTKAKEEFLLPDSSFDDLAFIKKKNPRKEGWTDMKLFMRGQVKQACLSKYGGMDEMEVERERRKQDAFDKGTLKAKRKAGESILNSNKSKEVDLTLDEALADDGGRGIGGGRGRPKGGKAAKQAVPIVGRHTHRWGNERWDEAKDTWRRSCYECGLTSSFEKL